MGWRVQRIGPTIPSPSSNITSVAFIHGIKPLLSNLLVYGRNEAGYGQLVLFNTTSNQEQNLIGSAELEIYHVEYSSSDATVRFDALRFSDGLYVLCTVSLDGPTLTCSPTGSARLVDFQNVSTPGVGIPPAPATPTPIPLMEFDFSGAKALSGDLKILADGSAESARKFSAGRWRGGSFMSDEQGNLWLAGTFYLTDQPSAKCSLARVDKSTGTVSCAFLGEGSITTINTAPNGRTYFTTSLGDNTKLFTINDGGATEIALLGQFDYWQPQMLTTQNGDFVIGKPGSSGWLRTYSPNGSSVDHGVNYTRKMGRLSDGRILIMRFGPTRTLNSNGAILNPQPYTDGNYYGYGEAPEVSCALGFYACNGYYASSILNHPSATYAVGRVGEGYDIGMVQYEPGPVAAFPFSQSFIQDEYGPVVLNESDTFYVAGTLQDSTKKIISFNVDTKSEQDLTDDPTFNVRSMAFANGKLYLQGYKRIYNSWGGWNEECYLGMKTLGGGTTLSRSESCGLLVPF